MSIEVEQNYLLKERHDKFVNKLKILSRDVPIQHRSKMNGKFLSEFANSLLDKTVFDILKNLQDIQDMTEVSLADNRTKRTASYKASRDKMLEQQKDALKKEYAVNFENGEALRMKQCEDLKRLDKRIEQELNTLDQRNIMEFDQCLSEQQQTLERVQVPGFCVTNDPEVIRFQVHLLNFIIALSKMENGEGVKEISGL